MYRLAKGHSNKMAKAGRLFHSGRYALQGGENICGGKGHHSPKDFVASWMKSSRHRAWLLDARVKTAAVGISDSRHGTYAAWSFSDQPLFRLRRIRPGFWGWLTRMFRPHYTVLRSQRGEPITRPLPSKPEILGWLTRVFKWSMKLLSVSLVLLGIHGLWVYFSRIEASLAEDTLKLFLAIQVPSRFQNVVEWMSLKGMQSWFFPTAIIVAGIILWRWLVPILQRKI